MISVIIPTYSRSTLLVRALDSIVRQIVNDKFEIIVVDNNSRDDTKEVTLKFIKQHPDYDIKYVYEEIPGLVAARHRGVKEAKYEILAFTDEDIEADKNWLSAIRNAFEDSEVMIVGGKVIPKYEIEPPDWMKWFWTTTKQGIYCGWLSLIDFGNLVIEIDPIMVWGVNYSIRKKALYELGGFHPDTIDEEYFCYGGDGETGLSIKAKERGLKAIYQPEALIYHFIPSSRMTFDYFKKRAYIQGKCDSFTQIRKLGKVPTYRNNLHKGIKTIGIFFSRIKHRILSQRLREEQLLRMEFSRSYIEGYELHQKAVLENPELLKWVLKENYWEYSISEIKIR